MSKKLIWFGRINPRGGTDVTITCNVDAKGETHFASITFRNGCFEKITDTKYIEMALDGNRMYFRGCDKHHGILLNSNQKVVDTTRYVKIQNERAPIFITWNGDYKLEYDEEENLYYIEREDKNE